MPGGCELFSQFINITEQLSKSRKYKIIYKSRNKNCCCCSANGSECAHALVFCEKLIFYFFQGSVGPVLRWGGKYYIGLVENLIVSKVQKYCENWLTFDKDITAFIGYDCNVLFLWITVCFYCQCGPYFSVVDFFASIASYPSETNVATTVVRY